MTTGPSTWRRAAVVLGALAVAANAVSTTFAGSSGAAAKRTPRIVWLEQGAGNPYWDAEHEAAREAGRRLGFRLTTVSGNLNPVDQAEILKQLVDQKVDLVMVNAIDARVIGPSLLYARDKRVPTVFLNGFDARAKASIGFDETRSGRVAATYALDLLKEHGRISGKIAVLEGIKSQPVGALRAKGFRGDVLRAGSEVVAHVRTDGQAASVSATMEALLRKYSDLSIVFATSDAIAALAMNVALKRNRLCTQTTAWKSNASCVAFVSVDGVLLDEVVKGRLFSTQLYSPYWTGYTYAKLAYEVATGKRKGSWIPLKSLLVTPDNARCVAKMAGLMQKAISGFQFEKTLQQTAEGYSCMVFDANM